MFDVIHFSYPLKCIPGPCDVKIEIKIEYTDKQFSPIFFRKRKNIFIVPKQISISDKSILFDGCPTDKLRKK